jgi:hypothetical protein
LVPFFFLRAYRRDVDASVSVLDPFHAIGKHRHIEVHQKTQQLLRMPQVRQNLSMMDGQNYFHRL